MSNPLALVVDDEPDIRELLEITLGRMSIDCRAAGDLHQAREWLKNEDFDLCLTDMRLPDGNGIELVKFVGEKYPNLPIAVITAHGNMESAIDALKTGAFDFVSKPVDLKILRKLVETALKLERPIPSKPPTENSPANNYYAADQTYAGKTVLLGKSNAIDRIRTMTRKLARSQAPVFIHGESGTGKELAARMIHEQGPRTDNSFVAVNCGAIPQELMESEFFGHIKGSFTGATHDKQGLFQLADGGTLFLDEVGDLPLPMQVKLLRAIQEKMVRPVGGQREISVDTRIISATHKDLALLVDQGEFRQDLFYRINVIELEIPALRERREDIEILANSLLKKIALQNNIPCPVIEKEALEQLRTYLFPGNVRELENILEGACALCEKDKITKHDLNLTSTGKPDLSQKEAIYKDLPLEDRLESLERDLIVKALEESHWNKTATAKKLGISFRALRYRLSKLGID
ncbi:MAG: sigma-54 dependent transcriptional regulator [Sedimenticola sp.]|nr:sigma-54 dependent transcriptional regulator [Sedimenticola sp.]